MLIEVIIAMSILFLSGLVSVHLTLEARTAVERATLREAELLAASQFSSGHAKTWTGGLEYARKGAGCSGSSERSLHCTPSRYWMG